MHVILHIGLPKTGTTFLQQQLAFHRETLAADGIYIPQAATFEWVRSLTGDPLSSRMACEENNHLMLAWALQPERWPQFPAAVQQLLPQVWDRLGEELAGCKLPYCLITAENLSWDFSNESQFDAVRDSLAGHDVSVICCMRKPHDFIPSMYGQLLSMDRGPYSIDDFVAEFHPRWETEFQEAVWSKAFGAGCFRGIAYESIAGPDILQQFLAAAIPGHPASQRTYPLMPNTDPHRSFSPRFQRFLEELHANGIETTQFTELYRSLPAGYAPLDQRLLTPAEINAAAGSPCHRPKPCPTPDDHGGRGPGCGRPRRGRIVQPSRTANRTARRGATALEIFTADLISVRQLLVERTARLEQALAERDQLATKLETVNAVSAIDQDGLESALSSAPIAGLEPGGVAVGPKPLD